MGVEHPFQFQIEQVVGVEDDEGTVAEQGSGSETPPAVPNNSASREYATWTPSLDPSPTASTTTSE